MLRSLKLFLVECQLVIEVKSLSVVWFLASISGSILMIIFWTGVTSANGGSISGWNTGSFATYYLLVALAGSLFIAHIEENVSFQDIQRGELSMYLLKPFPYFRFKLLIELPWRFMQGAFAIISMILVFLLVPHLIQITLSPVLLPMAILLVFSAFLLSFTFKMCLGLLAFWFTEINSLLQLTEIILTLCAGFIVPLVFLPNYLQTLFNILPFSYMVYYPILALLGKLNPDQEIRVFGIQMLWTFLFYLLYKFLWRKGRLKFTAVGH
ncbi:MAG: ABC transporter permease [Candidatus Levyibacteriota bacterium]